MTADYTCVQGDLSRPLEAVLSDERGAIDLSQAERVEFVMAADLGLPPVVEAEAEIDSSPTPDLGRVIYRWQPGETDIPGRYRAHFRVFFAGAPVTFPSDRYLVIDILPGLQTEGPTP